MIPGMATSNRGEWEAQRLEHMPPPGTYEVFVWLRGREGSTLGAVRVGTDPEDLLDRLCNAGWLPPRTHCYMRFNGPFDPGDVPRYWTIGAYGRRKNGRPQTYPAVQVGLRKPGSGLR